MKANKHLHTPTPPPLHTHTDIDTVPPALFCKVDAAAAANNNCGSCKTLLLLSVKKNIYRQISI